MPGEPSPEQKRFLKVLLELPGFVSKHGTPRMYGSLSFLFFLLPSFSSSLGLAQTLCQGDRKPRFKDISTTAWPYNLRQVLRPSQTSFLEDF